VYIYQGQALYDILQTEVCAWCLPKVDPQNLLIAYREENEIKFYTTGNGGTFIEDSITAPDTIKLVINGE